jgi:hypothetical protein
VCLIVDANVRNLLSERNSLVNAWLNGQTGNPRLVAGGKLLEELANKEDVGKRLIELERAGRLRSPDRTMLSWEETRLRRDGRCVSNDHHVLALAIVSGARTLATNDDDLIGDFKNKAIIDQPRGSVYRDVPEHKRLLRHTPESCGVHSSDDPGPRRRH